MSSFVNETSAKKPGFFQALMVGFDLTLPNLARKIGYEKKGLFFRETSFDLPSVITYYVPHFPQSSY